MAKINLQKIVSVKGETGLFHLVNYNSKGYFLQPFAGGPARFFSNEKGRVLAVGNVDLKLREGAINSLDIFFKLNEHSTMSENQQKNEIVKLFRSLFPTLDESVAPGHMEKIYKWYLIISSHFNTNEITNEEDDGLTIA